MFLVQVAKHPATLDFARQAVKAISDARSSNALLSWLVTKALGDPGHSPQISDKSGHPGVISPLPGHIRNSIRSYPSESSEQVTGFPRSDLYMESYHADSEAHAYSLQASLLKAGRRHCIREQTDLLRSSASPSYVSRSGEDVCGAKYVKETASIELPDDDRRSLSTCSAIYTSNITTRQPMHHVWRVPQAWGR